MAVWVGLIGVVGAAGIAALVSFVAERQSNRRLRLDAAMRAGGLLEPGPSGHADPAATARFGARPGRRSDSPDL